MEQVLHSLIRKLLFDSSLYFVVHSPFTYACSLVSSRSTLSLPPIPGVSTQPSDPPEQVLVDIEKIIKVSFSGGDGESHQSIQAPITLSGRVINAIIWEENLWSLI